jgi:putative sterol carrier protein
MNESKSDTIVANHKKLPPLTVADEESLDDIAERLAASVAALEISGRLTVGDSASSWTKSMTVGASDAGDSEAVVVADEHTLRRIARGTYSPVTAYLDGALTLSGDTALAKGILHKLGGAGSVVDVCPVLTSPQWQLNPPYQQGTLTLTGQFFTPDGQAVLIYDMGGESYQDVVTVDAGGDFTHARDGIGCGDIPGRPGVGVTVTATDLTSGLQTVQSYGTPC